MDAPSWRERLSPVITLSNNWISRIGVILVSMAGVFWLFLLPNYLQGSAASAYLGILLFLILPTAFFAGLALIPLGIFLRSRNIGSPIGPDPALPVISWANPPFRRLVTFVAAVTFVNMVIGANLTYRAVDYMDGVQFCGTSCHNVMKPEYVAYQNSAHSKVECVKCHIGPGASWFVQSKLSGVGQVIAVTFNTYKKPIPTPVENLRPARETCEGCHWPDKYGGDKLKVIPHFNDAGELTKSVLLMRIGGGNIGRGGIHTAHVGKGVRIRYGHSDSARQVIPWVEYSKDGVPTEFLASKSKKEDVAKLSVRQMDCVDCHNRPSHTLETPDRALDKAMAAGDVVPSLPEIRKAAIEILKKDYTSTEQAEKEIPVAMEQFFQQKLPEVSKQRQADIAKSAKGVLAVWQRNIFPEMKVTWGSYPNNIGHNDYPGCFRCHDAEHKTADAKKAIGQDCNACHALLAMEEKDPKILKDLGVE